MEIGKLLLLIIQSVENLDAVNGNLLLLLIQLIKENGSHL